MQTAINIAKKNTTLRTQNDKECEIPVGCVIVDDMSGKILAKSCNKTRKTNNPLQHAEIICINKALKKIKNNRLSHCSMYITLEPCKMCAGAISLAKVDKLYIGCLSSKTGHIVSNAFLQTEKTNHQPEIYYPVMENECKNIIRSFFRNTKIDNN